MNRSHLEPDPFPSPDALVAVVAARTDIGRERARNEDRAAFVDLARGRTYEPPDVAALPLTAGGLALLVCDGMGGEAGGQIASSLAVESITGSLRALYDGRVPPDDASFAGALVRSIHHASAEVRAVGRAEPRYARMGTTATLAALGHGTVVCAQVGDSRAYLFRKGSLVRLTRDQTFVELVRAAGGGLPVDEEGSPIGANVILQAIGSASPLDVVVTRTPIERGDALLLCTDGLHGVVDDASITEVLRTLRDPASAADALVARANERGGPDNVTCIVALLDRSA